MPVLVRKCAGRILRSVQSRRIFRAAGRKVVRDIRVTIASPADLEYVHSRLTSELAFKPDPADPQVTRFVATRHGRVIGFVELVRHPPEHAPYVGFWLFSLYVFDPLYRGLGIGEALARCVIKLARDGGGEELWLVVNEQNRPATNLYQKLGFKPANVTELDEQLKEEAKMTGRQRITMVKLLTRPGGRHA